MRRRPGSRYTWSKNRGGPAHTRSRLDRAFSNEGWVQPFPDSSVRNLPRTYSPLLVCLECSQNKQLRLDFLFQSNLSEVILGLLIAIFLLLLKTDRMSYSEIDDRSYLLLPFLKSISEVRVLYLLFIRHQPYSV